MEESQVMLCIEEGDRLLLMLVNLQATGMCLGGHLVRHNFPFTTHQIRLNSWRLGFPGTYTSKVYLYKIR